MVNPVQPWNKASMQAWNQNYLSFQTQVQEFNQKIQKKLISDGEIEEIYGIVTQATTHLVNLTRAAEAREEELKKKRCCCCSASVWTVAALNGLSKAAVIGGGALAIASETVVAKWAGLGIAGLGEFFDAASTVYIAKMTEDSENLNQLAKLNKQGAKHAEIFKKFLEDLKEVNRLEKQFIEKSQTESTSHEVRITVNSPITTTEELYEQIGKCLRQYVELPPSLQQEESYCRMNTIFIDGLPKTDPLRASLLALENIPKLEEIAKRVDQPLKVQYLPPSQPAMRKDDEWQGEEDARPQEFSETVEHPAGISQRDVELECAIFKHSVAKRFGVKPMPYIETPHGWRMNGKEGGYIKKEEAKA